MVVNFEHFFNGLRNDQSACNSFVTDQNYTIPKLETCGRSASLRSSSIFNLKQSSVWTECCNSVVVSSSARLQSAHLEWLSGSGSYQPWRHGSNVKVAVLSSGERIVGRNLVGSVQRLGGNSPCNDVSQR